MPQTATQKFLTFEDYLACENGSDTRYELVDGELVEMPPESPLNLAIARHLLVELLNYFPVEWVAWGTEIEVSGRRAKCRLPDLMIHSEESLVALAGASRATLTRDMPPPLLVIEIVSPGIANRTRDYRYKRTEYAARGISEYWIVDPELQQVTVCRWVDGAYEDTIVRGRERICTTIAPTLELTPEQLFAEPTRV